MRFLLFILASSLLSSTVSAADMTTQQTIIGAHDVLRGHFTETRHLQGFNGPMKSTGRFTVAPHYGLIWDLEKPFPTTTVITPAGLAQSINGVTVMNLPSQKIPFMQHLYDMLGGALAGNWTSLDADFIVTRTGDASHWHATLVPHDTDNPAMPFSSITVSGGKFVDQVIMQKPDGDSDTLTFFDEHLSSTPPTESEQHAFQILHP